MKDSTALFLLARFVEFINRRLRDGNLKTNKRNKFLCPVICCLGQLILDYSNFKSFSSRFRVRLRRESRYLAVEIRWMVGAGKEEEDTKNISENKLPNHSAQSRDTKISLNYLILLTTTNFTGENFFGRAGRSSKSEPSRSKVKSRLSTRMSFI